VRTGRSGTGIYCTAEGKGYFSIVPGRDKNPSYGVVGALESQGGKKGGLYQRDGREGFPVSGGRSDVISDH